MKSLLSIAARRQLASFIIAACLVHIVHAQPVATLAPMIERVSPAVVNISVSGRVGVTNPFFDDPFFRRFFGDQEPNERPFRSAGSGVIVDAVEGLILTNHHVIENADEITVTLLDDRSSSARVIGSDQASDLAVLQIDAEGLTQIEIGDSGSLRVGDFVVAIGNPFGLSHTVTSGIVSGLGRNNVSPTRDAYEDFIQTDASINPGNSGGALVNLEGRLVGINSAILSRSGGNIGIGFAIPVTMASNVLEQIVEYGKVQRGLLGVSIRPVSSELAEQYSLPSTAGAYVLEVAENSAADAARLQIEDVIVSVDGNPVASPDALRNLIGLRRPGESVEIGYIREGTLRTTVAVLGTQDSAVFSARAPEPEDDPPPEGLEPTFTGVLLAPETTRNGMSGLRVVEIEPDSPAAQAGLRQDDLITRLNRQRVTSLSQARAIVRSARGRVIAQVRRGSRDAIVLLP